MHPLARHGRACALLLITSVPALAGPAHSPEQPDVAVPPVHYLSAFDDYPPFRQAERAAWRAVNDTARQLGGHMGHMPMTPAALGEQPPHGHEHGGTP
ncbi:MAG: hypothetical protein AB1713_01435 [Pseudomonadota bacterium]|jgi:hypothetical protein